VEGSACCLFLAGYLLGSFFDPEDGSRKVLPNFNELYITYQQTVLITAGHSRKTETMHSTQS
jgi:hypothetical protein